MKIEYARPPVAVNGVTTLMAVSGDPGSVSIDPLHVAFGAVIAAVVSPAAKRWQNAALGAALAIIVDTLRG